MESFCTSFITEEGTPLVVEPKDKSASKEVLLEELRKNQPKLKKELLKYGAILFRNFPLTTPEHFSEVIDTMQTGKCVDYIGGDSPRVKVWGNIYTSTEAPPSLKIPLHNELSFVKNYPLHIYFFCEKASEVGGETILGDCRKIFKSIDPKVREKFRQKQLQYVSRYYYKSKIMDLIKGHKTWINVFETEQKSVVEKLCKENDFRYQWNKNDWIELRQTRPATLKHPITKEDLWFNQVHLYDFSPKLLGWGNYLGAKLFYCRKHTKLHDIYFADNTKIPREEIYHVLDVLDKNTIAFKWQKGDALMLDNLLMMHGRAPFEGKRRVLAAMTRSSQA